MLGVSLFGLILEDDPANEDLEADGMAATSEAPIMVCDLPLPVCPYVMRAQLKPSRRSEARGAAACWKTVDWGAFSWNIWEIKWFFIIFGGQGC